MARWATTTSEVEALPTRAPTSWDRWPVRWCVPSSAPVRARAGGRWSTHAARRPGGWGLGNVVIALPSRIQPSAITTRGSSSNRSWIASKAPPTTETAGMVDSPKASGRERHLPGNNRATRAAFPRSKRPRTVPSAVMAIPDPTRTSGASFPARTTVRPVITPLARAAHAAVPPYRTHPLPRSPRRRCSPKRPIGKRTSGTSKSSGG